VILEFLVAFFIEISLPYPAIESSALAEPKDTFLAKITDPYAKHFAEINYGPWDRLDNEKPFIEGYGEKPKGANYYPVDMTDEEFQALKKACDRLGEL